MPATLCALFFALCPLAAAQSAKPTEADVRFMQDMIGHHGQAVIMAALVPSRTTNRDIRLLAERIDVSQQDEMATMRHWLRARGADTVSAHHQHEPMPGMLTTAALDSLAAARGAAFDRLFLGFMIRHHEGALTMVARLFATAGSAQDPELASFASEVNADQLAEIRRMRVLLDSYPEEPGDARPHILH